MATMGTGGVTVVALLAATGCSEATPTKTADLDAGGGAVTTSTAAGGGGGAGGTGGATSAGGHGSGGAASAGGAGGATTSAGGAGGSTAWAIPAGDAPLGKPLTEWSESWFQWMLGLPGGPTHPINGGSCGAGQSGEVFHLVGTRTGATQCQVPEGKYLLAMIAHGLAYTDPENEGCSTPVVESDLVALAESGKPFVTERSAMLDGVPLADVDSYWTVSGKFAWAGGEPPVVPWAAPIGPNDCGIPEGDRTGAAFGYWVMIPPLPKGEHVLRVHSLMDLGPNMKSPWDAEIDLVIGE
jgi:hypothetical protein